MDNTFDIKEKYIMRGWVIIEFYDKDGKPCYYGGMRSKYGTEKLVNASFYESKKKAEYVLKNNVQKYGHYQNAKIVEVEINEVE